MPDQQQATPLCEICHRRPATTTQTVVTRQVPTCDICTPEGLAFALAQERLRGPNPPTPVSALALAMLDMIQRLAMPVPPPLAPGEEPATLDQIMVTAADYDLHLAAEYAGATWASERATPAELVRLSALGEPGRTCFVRLRDRTLTLPVQGRSVARAFHLLVRPDEDRPGSSEAFWDGALPKADLGKQARRLYVYGFAEGAVEARQMHSRFAG
jgi:hypothetical protein